MAWPTRAEATRAVMYEKTFMLRVEVVLRLVVENEVL